MQKSTYRFLFLFCFIIVELQGALAAQSYKKLEDKVNVRFERTNAAAVIKSLQSQTRYTFIYDPEYLAQCAVRDIKFNNGKLADVLAYLDQHAPVDIAYAADIISIRKGKAANVEQGRVAGRIVDNRNEALPGVTIQVNGAQGVLSNMDGTYELKLEPGTYTITFSYVSFESKKVTEVIVKEGQVTPLDIVLKTSASSLKGVTVTASYKRASVEGLYAIQKNSASLTDGISAEQIARTPDKNIGEVLKRVSGVATVDNKYVVVRGLSERYNQAMLNGQVMPSTELNRKTFSFDIIPSNMVENITVVKTLTPDRSAEFGGGLIEVNTLDIPTEDFLNISAGGSANSLTTNKTFKSLKLDGSEYWGRVAPHRKLLGSLDWKNTADVVAKYDAGGKNPSQFSNNWGIYERNGHPSQNYQLAGGKSFLKRENSQWGAVFSLSYRNTMQTQDVAMSRDGFTGGGFYDGPDTIGYVGQRYGLTTNLGGLAAIGYKSKSHRISFNTIYLRTLDQQLLLGTGNHEFLGGGMSLGYYDITQQTDMWQYQLKGEHALGDKGIKLRWMGSYNKLDRQKPDNHQLVGQVLQSGHLESNEYNISNPVSMLNAGALRWWSRALESSVNWDAGLSMPFNVGKFSNSAKVGYAGWYKDRLFYVMNTGSAGYNTSDYPPLSQLFVPERGGNIYLSRFVDDFHRTAVLHAPYAMLDNKLNDKWRLVWGVRAEYYDLNKVNAVLDSLFRQINGSRGGSNDFDYSALLNREKSLNWFPSANLTYSLTSRMNLRLAYSKSIVRPDLRELSFFREYDYELGGAYESDLVKSSIIHHYDFRYEWYPGPGEILSFSLFYKDLKDPMEIYKHQSATYFLLKNNKAAKNYGIELEARKSLGFTNVPVVRNLTLYGNFTYLKSKVTPVKLTFDVDPADDKTVVIKEEVLPEEDRPQAGASNYVVNGGIYYDTKPLSASLVYNYVSNRMLRPSEIYFQSLFERPLEALDAQIAIRPLKQLELRLNVSNLLNSYTLLFENYSNDLDLVTGAKVPSSTKELLYKRGTDRVIYKSRPGRTFSATLTYRF
ncbi:TonB-dependent receptor [Chitinophaga horti]|uniref:TonB-dependent receptor n=1 Tax=Chitinophaga horti TaxID=2920382 RepID=A0ABY6J5B1_9BACT|nr:TonB-dependent receptor [Chitinophaga horti]UYQ93772.1 TonB-dependent receptor [Chitinophaga horti]